ncbi:hypothetical protein [Sphingomonas sp. UYP23]
MNLRLVVLALAAAASPLSAQQLSFDAVQPDAAAVRIMEVYARCAVAHDPKRAAEIVNADYRTDAYQVEIRSFAMKERSCVPRAGKLKFQPIVFAGNIAEDLLRRRGIDVSALEHAPPPSSPEGPIACVVHTQASQVAELFRTPPASSAETQAVARIQVAMADCLPSGRSPITNKVVLRAMLALVSYRFATAS